MFRSFFTFILLLCFSLQLYAQAGEQSTYPNGINSIAPTYREYTIGTSNQTTLWTPSASTPTIITPTITSITAIVEEAPSFTISNSTVLSTNSIVQTERLSTSTPEPAPNALGDATTTVEMTTTVPPPIEIITETSSLLTTTTLPPTASTAVQTSSLDRASHKYPPAVVAGVSVGCGSIILCLSGVAVYIWIRRRQVKEPDFITEPVSLARSPPAIEMYLEDREEEDWYIDIEKDKGEIGSDTDVM